MKKCTKCQEEKPFSNFSYNKRGKDKLTSWCKKCKVEWNKNSVNYHQYQKKNREKIYKKKKQRRIEIRTQYGLGAVTISRYGFKIALFVYDKADRKCEQCGDENDLTIHHLNGEGRHYQEKGGKPDNDIKNLVVWCRSCHGSFHGKQGKGIKKSKKG